MSQNMHLIGSEEVARAGHTMSRAASEMQSAAGSMDHAFERNQRFMDDWLMRFEAIVDKLIEATKP